MSILNRTIETELRIRIQNAKDFEAALTADLEKATQKLIDLEMQWIDYAGRKVQ